jgi:pyruvate,water dikinase
LLVHALDAASTTAGKAAALARLRGAGLPVPDGFVITHQALVSSVGHALDLSRPELLAMTLAEISSCPIPAALAEEVAPYLVPWRPLMVRSSVSNEDQSSHAAAGIFSSFAVATPEEFWPAVRRVWASALTPWAIRYAHAQGLPPADIAVVAQVLVPGQRVTVYTRPPGHPAADELWLEPENLEPVRLPRDPTQAPLRWTRVVELALAAERAIAASAGADVELVVGDHPVVVQARGMIHPAPAPELEPPPPELFGSMRSSGRTWRWDLEHNPDPLSPAQAGLVALVEERGASPYRMCTVAGYLYFSAPATDAAMDVCDGTELRARFAEGETQMRQALGAAGPEPSVSQAIECYLSFYRLWANQVSPLVAAASRALLRALTERHGDPQRAAHAATEWLRQRPTSVASCLRAAAKGQLDWAQLLARIGDVATAWDVSSPTLGENPSLLRDAIARLREGRSAAPTPMQVAPDQVSAAHAWIADMASAVAELCETDDLWFFRAQALVRHALLRAGSALGLDPIDDIFWLPLNEVASAASLDPLRARARAGAARAAHARSRRWRMPIVVGGSEDECVATAGTWTGQGWGPLIRGRIHHVEPGDDAVPVARCVVLLRAITPASVVFLAGATAVISESGGILSHGAAMARELNVPFVVGCRDVWRGVSDGDLVEVDGAAGVVRKLPAPDWRRDRD